MDAEILTEVEQSFRRRCRRSPMVSGAGRLELAVWEWRASVAGRGGAVETGGLRADGGWREQRTSDDSEPSAWWTFEVGTDLDGAGRRAEDEVVALAGQAAQVDLRLEFRVWGRVRCWWRPDSEPTALWEQGIALTLRAGEESRQWLV
ncbi:MAG TPA: hypothetical protein ENK10_10450, partial [Acidobacteria bacterium]|nr:hypothetical protein [Acidobacteriota bacterium]